MTEIPLQEITELENFEEEDLPDVTTLVGSNLKLDFKFFFNLVPFNCFECLHKNQQKLKSFVKFIYFFIYLFIYLL